MANVPPGDNRLWVHLVSVYVVSFIAMRVGRASAHEG